MAQVYFHCSRGRMKLLDQEGAEVDSLGDARLHAAQVVHTLLRTSIPEDWRDWVVHISDDLGEEILEMPFSAVIGKPH